MRTLTRDQREAASWAPAHCSLSWAPKKTTSGSCSTSSEWQSGHPSIPNPPTSHCRVGCGHSTGRTPERLRQAPPWCQERLGTDPCSSSREVGEKDRQSVCDREKQTECERKTDRQAETLLAAGSSYLSLAQATKEMEKWTLWGVSCNVKVWLYVATLSEAAQSSFGGHSSLQPCPRCLPRSEIKQATTASWGQYRIQSNLSAQTRRWGGLQGQGAGRGAWGTLESRMTGSPLRLSRHTGSLSWGWPQAHGCTPFLPSPHFF